MDNAPMHRTGAADTDWTDRPSTHFQSTGRKLIIGGLGINSPGRLTFLYLPSEAAKAWDQAPESTTHAIGSRHGFYCYVTIKVTGRKDRYIPGYNEPLRKCRISLNIGTIDETTSEAWLVGGGTV